MSLFSSAVKKATSTVTNVVQKNPISYGGSTTPYIPKPKLPNYADDLAGILKNNPSLSYGGSTTPNIPIPNIPTPGGSLNDVGKGVSLLTKNVGYVADEILGGGGKIINRNLHELAKVGKEAVSGEGGYADDAGPGPAEPGPTGFEAATAQRTLLTGQRRKGQGRAYHAGSGSATTV